MPRPIHHHQRVSERQFGLGERSFVRNDCDEVVTLTFVVVGVVVDFVVDVTAVLITACRLSGAAADAT